MNMRRFEYDELNTPISEPFEADDSTGFFSNADAYAYPDCPISRVRGKNELCSENRRSEDALWPDSAMHAVSGGVIESAKNAQ